MVSCHRLAEEAALGILNKALLSIYAQIPTTNPGQPKLQCFWGVSSHYIAAPATTPTITTTRAEITEKSVEKRRTPAPVEVVGEDVGALDVVVVVFEGLKAFALA
jgi:hypothetical protein